jgi:hypothetical protein
MHLTISLELVRMVGLKAAYLAAYLANLEPGQPFNTADALQALSMSKHELSEARKELGKAGLTNECLTGLPAKLYVIPEKSRLSDYFIEVVQIDQQEKIIKPKREKQAKPKRDKKEPHRWHHELRLVWEREYLAEFKNPFVWGPMYAKGLSDLIPTMQSYFRIKFNREADISDLERAISIIIKQADAFDKKQLTPNYVNRNYNKITSSIIGGNNPTGTVGRAGRAEKAKARMAGN